jgi:hypothetical protein
MITTVSPTPVARTRSSTSFGPIFGIGTSRSSSGAPNFGRTIAFISSASAVARSAHGVMPGTYATSSSRRSGSSKNTA